MGTNYAITDIHGMYDLWRQVKEYCKPDDKIYFLGDAADRGPDGFKIIKELLSDPRVIYLKGNHEDMFYICGNQYLDNPMSDFLWWYNNGGYETAQEFIMIQDEQKQKSLLKILNDLPDHLTIVNAKGQEIFLSHAGTNPDYDSIDFMLCRGGDPYLWDRKHFYRNWPQGYDNLYVCHGHTPVQFLAEDLNKIQKFRDLEIIKYPRNEVINYANGHKFDLDLGSFSTGKLALFNLDELKVEKYFYTEDIFKQ